MPGLGVFSENSELRAEKKDQNERGVSKWSNILGWLWAQADVVWLVIVAFAFQTPWLEASRTCSLEPIVHWKTRRTVPNKLVKFSLLAGLITGP